MARLSLASRPLKTESSETYTDHACRVRDTAKALKRSPHTVTRHIEDHRLEVLRDGSCARCRRVKGRELSNALNRTPGEGSHACSADLVSL